MLCRAHLVTGAAAAAENNGRAHRQAARIGIKGTRAGLSNCLASNSLGGVQSVARGVGSSFGVAAAKIVVSLEPIDRRRLELAPSKPI